MSPHYIAWISFTMTIGAIAALDLYLPAAPFLASYFGVEDITLKYTFIVNPLVGCFSGIPFGYYSDQWGRKPLIILAISLFLGGTLLCGLSTQINFFFIGRILQALGSGGILVLNGALLADIFSGTTLARYLGIYGSFFPLVFAIAPIVGAFILNYVQWRAIFFFNFLLMALSFFLVIFYIPETLKKEKNQLKANFLNQLKNVINTPHLFVLLAIHALPICLGAMFTVNSSFLYINIFLFSPLAYSLAQCIPVAGQFVGAQLYKTLVSTLGIKNSLKVGGATTLVFMVTSSALLMGILSLNPYTLVIAITILSVGANFLISSAATLLLDGKTTHKGTLMSLLSLSRNLLISFILIFSFFFSQNDPAALLYCMIFVSAIQGFLVFYHINFIENKRKVPSPL